MRKSNQSPKQSNTLLNYFNRTQSTPKSDNSSPISSRSDRSKTNQDVNTNGNLASTSKQSNKTDDIDKLDGYQLYDLVWAKLEGFVFYCQQLIISNCFT